MDNQFHAPLPPKAPALGSVPPLPKTEALAEPALNDVKSAFHFMVGHKWLMALAGGAAMIGLLLGAVMFAGGKTTTCNTFVGLNARIVGNPDIHQPFPYCGATISEAYTCIIYIMNHSRNDRRGEDFFKEAEKLSGRQEFLIRIENKDYTQKRIPPGFFAQIKIPPLR